MKIDLTDTTASKINKALVQGRRAIGTPAVGMVLTMVIVTDEENAYDSIRAAEEASHEHPSRTLVVIKRHARTPRDRTRSHLDAEVRVGADAGTGETVVLRMYGEVSEHADSVVLPLLLPDAPVVVWWPVDAPENPARDPLGALAQRRITDLYAVEQPLRELEVRARHYAPGDTDLAWTRLTPWRSMLAAALDQVDCEVKAVEGGFSVEATATQKDKALTIILDKIAPTATEEAPAKGGIAYVSAKAVDSYLNATDTPCDFYFIAPSQGVASGRVWVSFKCPKIEAEGSTCAISQGYAIFENCSE